MRISLSLTILLIFSLNFSFGQKNKRIKKKELYSLKYNNLNWRNIGPFRGGRSVASTGVLKHPIFFTWEVQAEGSGKQRIMEFIGKYI